MEEVQGVEGGDDLFCGGKGIARRAIEALKTSGLSLAGG